jgi:hypothetical protein
MDRGAPEKSAERMRRLRRRRRFRLVSIKIEVDQAEIDALIKQGYVDAALRSEVAAISHAVTAFISDTLVLGASRRNEAASRKGYPQAETRAGRAPTGCSAKVPIGTAGAR